MMQGNTTTTATTTTNISARRKIITARNGVVSGCVWENRMKMDQIKGGIKVFNGNKSNNNDDDNGNDSNVDEEGARVYQRLKKNQNYSIVPGKKRRRNWTPPAAISADEVLVDKSPVQLRKARSGLLSNSPRLRVVKSLEFAGEKKPMLLGTDGSEGGGGDDKVEREVEVEMEEDTNIFDDKEMDFSTVEEPKNVEEEKTMNEIDEIPEDEEQNSLNVVSSEEIEKQQNPEIVSSAEVEMKQNSAILAPLVVEKIQDPVIVSLEAVEKKLNHVIVSAVAVEKKQSPVTEPAVDAEKKQIARYPRRRIDLDSPELQPSSEGPKQVFPDARHDCHNRMQTIVDLVMWRDVSKSAFVFGLGTFILISSSYTKDLNFSLISATSYVSLIYLALIFTYTSILHRGESTECEERDESYLVGEEEAIWLIRKVLPYINELLVSLKALFSGDPATTMKLAVLLIVMARCGSSITIWSLIKLVFFGVFTIPKVCSSYSYQLAKYGKFWLDRLRDGWESCTHKKAVAAGIFAIIWNISSTVARIWALFMLVVGFKLYQQCVSEDWASEEQQEEVVVDEIRVEDSKPVHRQGIGLHHRQRGGTTRAGVGQERKVKKWL